MAVELGVGYISLVPSAKGIVAGIQQELGGPLTAAAATSGAKTSNSFAAAFKTGIKKVAVPAAVIGGIVAIGAKFEGAFATIARGTGETGKTLAGLDASFKTVLKSGSGSFAQVSDAITILHQRTGLTGKALEDFAAKEVALARITKTDVAANLQATTGLFNLYGIAADQQSAKLDVLFRASQVAGVSVTQLASDMQAAAPTAKALGLTIDQTASLVAGLDKAGLPAGKVMLGLASAFAKAAKAGQDPLSVIHDLVTEIKAAPTATAAATIATTKFGIGARQATTLVAGLRSGAINLDATLKGGKGILDTAAATQTLSEKFANLKNRALVGLEPLVTAVIGGLTRSLVDALPAVELLSRHMEILGPILVGATAGFIAFKVALGIKALVTGLTTAFNGLRASLVGSSAAEAAATATAIASTRAHTTAAAAAVEAAAALKLEAEASVQAALASGTVDLAELAAAQALVAKAEAAAIAADAMATDAAATEAAAVAAATAAVAGKGLLASLGPIGFIAAGVGVALAAITVKTSLFGHGQQDAGKATNDFIASLLDEGKTLDQVAGQLLVKAIRDNKGLADSFTAINIPLKTVNSALLGNKTAVNAVSKAALDGVKSGKISLDQYGTLTSFLTKNAQSLDEQSQAKHRAGDASKELADKEHAVIDPAKQAALAQDQLRLAATNLTTAIINNTDRLRGLQEGLIGVFQSAVNLKKGVQDVADKQTAYNDAIAKFGAKSKEATAAQQDLQLAQLGQVQSTLQAIDQSEKYADSVSHLSDKQKALVAAQAARTAGKGSDADVAKAQRDVAAAQKINLGTIQALIDKTSGPLHDALVGYRDDIRNLPPTKTTTLVAEKRGAETSLTTWKHELADTALKGVTTNLHLNTGPAVQDIIRFTHSIPGITLSVRGVGVLAKGGPAKPGRDYVVGEVGPELLHMNAGPGGFVTSNAELVGSQPLSLSRALEPRSANEPTRPPIVFTGDIRSWDDRDLARRILQEQRKAEILAGV